MNSTRERNPNEALLKLVGKEWHDHLYEVFPDLNANTRIYHVSDKRLSRESYYTVQDVNDVPVGQPADYLIHLNEYGNIIHAHIRRPGKDFMAHVRASVYAGYAKSSFPDGGDFFAVSTPRSYFATPFDW